jgi:Ribbon-helix-helix protein, copG family
MALDLLKKKISPKEVVFSLELEFGLSARQAYRYLQQAQRITNPLAVPEPKAVFTVKLPSRLIGRVRQMARRRRQPISALVNQALEAWLTKSKTHG